MLVFIVKNLTYSVVLVKGIWIWDMGYWIMTCETAFNIWYIDFPGMGLVLGFWLILWPSLCPSSISICGYFYSDFGISFFLNIWYPWRSVDPYTLIMLYVSLSFTYYIPFLLITVVVRWNKFFTFFSDGLKWEEGYTNPFASDVVCGLKTTLWLLSVWIALYYQKNKSQITNDFSVTASWVHDLRARPRLRH